MIDNTTNDANYREDKSTNKVDDLSRMCNERLNSSDMLLCYHCTNISRPICKFRQI